MRKTNLSKDWPDATSRFSANPAHGRIGCTIRLLSPGSGAITSSWPSPIIRRATSILWNWREQWMICWAGRTQVSRTINEVRATIQAFLEILDPVGGLFLGL